MHSRGNLQLCHGTQSSTETDIKSNLISFMTGTNYNNSTCFPRLNSFHRLRRSISVTLPPPLTLFMQPSVYPEISSLLIHRLSSSSISLLHPTSVSLCRHYHKSFLFVCAFVMYVFFCVHFLVCVPFFYLPFFIRICVSILT